MALIVPGVCRYAINQSLYGRAVVNVLDMRIDTTGSTMDRPTAVFNQAGDFITQWEEDLLPLQNDELTFESVSWVDLDSASGTTGSRTSSSTVTLPQPGQVLAAGMVPNTAILVRKQIVGERSRRNGRMFLGGINETQTSDNEANVLTPASLATAQSAVDGFLADINNVDATGTAFSSDLVVVHITARDVDGNPTAGDFAVVNQLIVDGTLATQRRRLRG